MAGGYESWWKQARSGTGVEVEKVDSNGDAEVLLAFELEGSIGEVREGEICCWIVGFREPALVGRRYSLCHGGMIAPADLVGKAKRIRVSPLRSAR